MRINGAALNVVPLGSGNGLKYVVVSANQALNLQHLVTGTRLVGLLSASPFVQSLSLGYSQSPGGVFLTRFANIVSNLALVAVAGAGKFVQTHIAADVERMGLTVGLQALIRRSASATQDLVMVGSLSNVNIAVSNFVASLVLSGSVYVTRRRTVKVIEPMVLQSEIAPENIRFFTVDAPLVLDGTISAYRDIQPVIDQDMRMIGINGGIDVWVGESPDERVATVGEDVRLVTVSEQSRSA